jgi:hypothetical protein
MANGQKFWQRVTSVFRSSNSGEKRAGPETAGNEHGAVPKVGEPQAPDDPKSGSLATMAATRNVPWWRRGRERRAQARELSLHMVHLAEAIREHVRRQDERAAELSGSMARVGEALRHLADGQTSQVECLRSIAEHAAASGRNTEAVARTMERIPDSLLSQAEAVRGVARQLEVSQEADTQLMHSLQQFGQAVGTLGSSGEAQVEVLQKMNTTHQQQADTMAELVREQGRRFVLILVIAAVLALVSVAVLVITLVMNLTWA